MKKFRVFGEIETEKTSEEIQQDLKTLMEAFGSDKFVIYSEGCAPLAVDNSEPESD